MAQDYASVALTFKYPDIKQSGEPFDAELPLEVAREALEGYVGPSGYWIDAAPQASGTLYKSPSGEVIADVRLKGEARFECVSCGAKRKLSIAIREDLVIVPEGHDAAQESDEISGEGESIEMDPDVYTFKGPTLDLAPILRETLVLEVPLHPRCESVGETCVRLASMADQEEPEEEYIDPRFAPLLAMREALKAEEEGSDGEGEG
jgi:uncharacterized metal-binding protein YceD (DUF177 family)